MKMMLGKVKKMLAILLAVLFLGSVTAAASAVSFPITTADADIPGTVQSAPLSALVQAVKDAAVQSAPVQVAKDGAVQSAPVQVAKDGAIQSAPVQTGGGIQFAPVQSGGAGSTQIAKLTGGDGGNGGSANGGQVNIETGDANEYPHTVYANGGDARGGNGGSIGF